MTLRLYCSLCCHRTLKVEGALNDGIRQYRYGASYGKYAASHSLADCGYEVPVAASAAAPLKREFKGPVPIFTVIAGSAMRIFRDRLKLLAESAADFLIRMASENPGRAYARYSRKTD